MDKPFKWSFKPQPSSQKLNKGHISYFSYPFLQIKNSTIFISIAAYRDSEITPTVQDALAKAANPDKISFGIVWQGLPEDEILIRDLKNLSNCRIIEIEAHKSLGAGWARSLAQRLLYDEDFILQLDSHHRFEQDWDQILLETWAQCKTEKPILSGYPPPYIPPAYFEPGHVPTRIAAKVFDDFGILGLKPVGNLTNYEEPQIGMFLAGGFIFAKSQFYLEVPYDPFIYFQGEEISLSVRAWTAGWDIFYPHRIILRHYYLRSDEVKHWKDNRYWTDLDIKSRRRVLNLLTANNGDQYLGVYGLGSQRTLKEYEEFTGINFQEQIIPEEACQGIPRKAYYEI